MLTNSTPKFCIQDRLQRRERRTRRVVGKRGRPDLHVAHSHSENTADVRVGTSCILYTITNVPDWKTHLPGKDEIDRYIQYFLLKFM